MTVATIYYIYVYMYVCLWKASNYNGNAKWFSQKYLLLTIQFRGNSIIYVCAYGLRGITQNFYTHTHLNTLSWSQLSASEYSQAGLKLRQLKKLWKYWISSGHILYYNTSNSSISYAKYSICFRLIICCAVNRIELYSRTCSTRALISANGCYKSRKYFPKQLQRISAKKGVQKNIRKWNVKTE